LKLFGSTDPSEPEFLRWYRELTGAIEAAPFPGAAA
jgi:hypothetical protein